MNLPSTTPSMALAASHGSRIRSLHDQARSLAGQAIDTAREAGLLLCEVKEQLPHGAFGAWVSEQCGFTQRTAQRYMDLHRNPDRLNARSLSMLEIKCDTVSLLEWIEPSAWDWTSIEVPDGPLIEITPSAEHSGFLHISVMKSPTGPGCSDVIETIRPVRPSFVYDFVQHVVGDKWRKGSRVTNVFPQGFTGPLWASMSKEAA